MKLEQARILKAIIDERTRQDLKWGEQNHPSLDALDADERLMTETILRTYCDQRTKAKTVCWEHILNEEVAEAYATKTEEALVAELTQAAAVIVGWLECIERRKRNEAHRNNGPFGEG